MDGEKKVEVKRLENKSENLVAEQYSKTTGSHVGPSESDMLEAFVVELEEKATAAKTVEELMTMKAILGELRKMILKRLKDLEKR